MGHHRLDNGEYMMRRVARAQEIHDNMMRMMAQAQQQMVNQYNPYGPLNYRAYQPPMAGPPTPGERPEPEDITGLRLLEEFLQKRRDGNKGE